MHPEKDILKVLLASIVMFSIIYSGLSLANQAIHPSATEETPSKSLTYLTGSANGYNGPIHVRVGLQDTQIVEITVMEHTDDIEWYLKAKKGVIPAIIEQQSTDVDVVTGATFSSEGIMNAVKNAFDKRGDAQ